MFLAGFPATVGIYTGAVTGMLELAAASLKWGHVPSETVPPSIREQLSERVEFRDDPSGPNAGTGLFPTETLDAEELTPPPGLGDYL